MKSERRHELQTNELADKLSIYVEQIKPYGKTILGGVLAVIALALAYSYMSQQKLTRSGQGWGELFNVIGVNDPLRRDEDAMSAELELVAKRNQGTLPGLWALATEANLDLETGIRKMFTNRDEAKEQLERAQKNFERVEKEAGRVPLLLQEARFGLAQTYESLGDVNKAKEKYDQVTKSGPETALGKSAAARSKMLSDEEYKNFVAWFQQQKPKSINPHAGIPGMGGQIPGMNPGGSKVPPLNFDDLPQGPNINFPKTPGDVTLPGADDKKDDKKPEGDKPETEKPADKPSEEPKPDAEKKQADPAPTQKPADKPSEKPADAPAKSEAKPEAKKEAATEKPAAPAPDKKDAPSEAKKDDKKDEAAPAKP